MKKFLKLGCVCVVLPLAITLIMSLLDFFKSLPASTSLSWEKKGSGKFLSVPAGKQVKNFLAQHKSAKSYSRDSNIYCATATSSFDKRYFIKKHNVELKAFLLYLADLAIYVNGNTKEDDDGGLHFTAKLRWGDFDINVDKKVSWQGCAKQIEVIRKEKISVSKKGVPYITYIRNNQEEKLTKRFSRKPNSSAYDGFIRNFLKHQPEAVKFEYAAWSWNKEKKEGEFALCLIVDTSGLQLK